jgi:hypothetical protein
VEGQTAAYLRIGRTKLSRIRERRRDIAAADSLTASCPEADTLSQSDPTDHALAAIASILDQPESSAENAAAEAKPVVPAPVEADGYSKTGPGPMAAIRFKWTSRRDDHGDYYVDETIGDNSRPITSGPMSRDAAIQFVDDRAGEARRRFEQFKSDMTGHDATVDLARKISGEM